MGEFNYCLDRAVEDTGVREETANQRSGKLIVVTAGGFIGGSLVAEEPGLWEEFAALVLLELLGSSASPKDHILGESFTKIIIDSLHPPA